MDRTIKTSLIGLVTNTAFAAYYLVFGILSSSWWLLTLGSYYLILSLVRFAVLRNKSSGGRITNFAGWMLILLTIPLVGTVILSLVGDRGNQFHMIVMIAIAAYTFTKIILAIINLIKARGSLSETLVILRNISFADSLVSIFALQRSMLVSFEGMNDSEILIMNASLGCAVCIIVFILGFHLVRKRSNHI